MRVALLASATIAVSALGAAAVVACITTPPPDLPVIPPHRPTILHESVVPPENELLVQWPLQWEVPIELDDPTQSFYYDVFYDYDPVNPHPPMAGPVPVQPMPSTVDGGVFVVTFTLPVVPDPRFCHLIEFVVAHGFNTSSLHTPDSIGGDRVYWRYTAGGGPNGCPVYDAGALQDGAFPPADASDALPIPPPDAAGEP